jgi:putative nucleotidyltransferase with HDIG domain
LIDSGSQTQPALISVDILTFRKATRDIDFDVYIKLSNDNVAHVFSRSTGLDYKRLAQYIQKGVKELYIRAEDEAAYKAFISRPAQEIFSDPNTPQEKKIATLLNMTEQNMAEIFSQFAIEDETAQSTQKLLTNYVELMAREPSTLTVILRLVSHGEYLYYHSIAVSIFSMFLAKATGQFNQQLLELVALGGFLHDIGCTQLPKEIICSPDELTSSEWEEMKSHPKIGLKMIENTQTIPDEARYIVYQHHEEPGGRGYPNSIRGNVIYYPARIVAVADAFSALISKRPFRPAYSVDEALRIIKEQTGKYDPELVQILTSIFSQKK